ncbi:cytochrome C oxidase subunit IV family protein [Devosia sp. PTR5]|uniref:Cytochrome bo(3) ubiquinol oxidase subunit 4 n=1 Tax=Devosia oryzisoli TaxID=2774138 RepID=A0A927ITH6_9HYPH|nr:cytochrome C oxidase subunit IV family protein [Devosia oryzisoli]MBD8065823.1 cytochrome C oxidase subunit IV family protein [Devosia oryzisoli]
MTHEQRERRSYFIGFAACAAWTALAFGAVILRLDQITALWIIGVSALAQVVLQFRYFLHIDFSRQKREDLQLILFSALLLAIMVGGTVWILADLDKRMM